jgi:hypothetical protein
MAQSTRNAPAQVARRSSPQSKKPVEENSYWASLNQTLDNDEYEVMLPREVHGIKRSTIHRKI